MTEKRIIQLSISAIGILFIVGHMIWPDIKIDGITFLLIVIIIVPWLAPVFKSFELPGGLKVEFHDFEKATKKLKESGLIKKECRLPKNRTVINSNLLTLNSALTVI